MKLSLGTKLRLSRIRSVCKNENGAVLVIGLMFLAILALLGTTAVVMTTTDMQIGANYKASTQASCDADAGVNYGLGMMEAGLKANPATFTMPTVIGDPTDPSDANSVSLAAFTAPSGFGFSYQDPGLTMLATNLYTFTTAGAGPNSSSSSIITTCKRLPAINYAAFGDKKLDTKNGGQTLSYDSSSSDPTKNDPSDPSFQTTHEADVGSNDWLVTHNGASIDGSGVLGEKVDGSATTNSIHGGTNFYGTTPVDAGRVDPDPLGVNSGGEYDPTSYSAINDNNLAVPPITTNSILLKSSGTAMMTLYGKAGGANYYVTSIDIRNGTTLNINASAGEVRIFLDGGGISTGNTAQINITGDPTDFSIFSNSTTKIDFQHGSAFKGLVYAPYAPVDIKNSSDVYGAIWGSQVDIKNSGTLYYDSALSDKFTTKDLALTSWRDVRN